MSKDGAYVFYGYIYFDTTAETRRQKKIFGEPPGIPVIGTCFTAEIYRGKGVYRRVLNDVFRYLAELGYERATADVNTHNTASNKASAAAGMSVCRELSDWIVMKRLLVQRVKDTRGASWRIAIV